MEPSTSSQGVLIPRDKLKIWKIFRNVGPEGEEILKTAKLAHPASGGEGFVVTMSDETYTFLRQGGVLKITRIPELCGVQVKEFVLGHICLAVTEDGFLYSWITDSLLSGFWPSESTLRQLGRFEGIDDDDTDWSLPENKALLLEPHRVLGPVAGEKVHLAAMADRRVVVLTVGGDIYKWDGDSTSEPILIEKKHFEDKEIISLACIPYVSLALTSDGQMFQWEFNSKLPEKLTGRFKKITASKASIFALSVDGGLHRLGFPIHYSLGPDELVWKNLFFSQKFQDVATSRLVDGVVVELKDNVRFAFRYLKRSYDPYIASFSPNCTSMDEFLAEMSQLRDHTIRGHTTDKPRSVSDDISNLWVTKENVDITFSVEGKTITAHKFILSLRSGYFAKMLKNAWKETNDGSAIEIKDTTFDIFEALLFYIYNDKIYFPEDNYENIYGLMKLADYHCSFDIRRECEKILIRNINTENAIFLARNASMANASELEKNVLKFILDKRLLDVNSTPQELIELLGMETVGGLTSSNDI